MLLALSPKGRPEQAVNYRAVEDRVRAHRRLTQWHGQREREVAAQHLDRRDPDRRRKIDEGALLHAGDDVAADARVTPAADLALVEIGVVLEEDSRRRQEARHRPFHARNVEAHAALGGPHGPAQTCQDRE